MALKPTITQVAKPQTVRLADVLLIGPLMIWGGVQARKKNAMAGNLLAFFGLGTIFYNAENYLLEQERRRRQG